MEVREMKKEGFGFSYEGKTSNNGLLKILVMSGSFGLISFFVLFASVLTVSAQSPAVSIGHQQLSITYEECLARGRQALELEGYAVSRGGGNFYWGGKGIHHATIVCDENVNNRTDVHVFVASNAIDGNLPGAERVRLQQWMENPPTRGKNQCAPFEGVWSTNYTPIAFRRTGNRVTGSYEYQGVSTLSGTLNGNVLEGEYSQPSYPSPLYQRGRFRMVLSSDGQSFIGQWWDANGNTGGPWNGNCQTPSNGSTASAAGICDNPQTISIMDEWLRTASPVENRTAGYNLRYESWGRLIGSSPTANISAPNPPDTDLTRCEWLWKQADKLRSTNLGNLREYVERRRSN
jgi:hypothetical protein